MLTCCGCLANPEQTQILTPCQLHDQWARATYAPKAWGGDAPLSETQRAFVAARQRAAAQAPR